MKKTSGQEQCFNKLKEKGHFKNFANYQEWEKRKKKGTIPIKLPKENYQDWYDKLPQEVKNRLKKP